MTNDKEFLNWLADRLVHVYGESPNVDFVHKLRAIAKNMATRDGRFSVRSLYEPFAYAAVATDGSESIYVASLREQAEAACREYDWMLIPLYPGPQTWQDETAAVETAFERSGVKPTWPADEAGNIGPMAAAMADEIERLRQFDRPQPIKSPDATLATHATPTEGSVPGEGSVLGGER